MTEVWVDFAAVKQAVTMDMVLGHYGITLKRRGKELGGRCPIHNGEGDDTFRVHPEKNVFNCFSCKAHGNVLDLVAALEQTTIREAALKLAKWFSVSSPTGAVGETTAPARQLVPKERTTSDEDAPNKPLTFRLRGIDSSHQYFTERGIHRETAEWFGAGYFSGKGLMSGRIVIPIENEVGELVAYAGRAINGSEPKYLFPSGFKKGQVLFNLVRALEYSKEYVVLVEGFFDCMKVAQAEFACVALMGCAMSQRQQAQIAANFQRAIILLDGDDAGHAAATQIAGELAWSMAVRTVNLARDSQPDQLSTDEIKMLLCGLF